MGAGGTASIQVVNIPYRPRPIFSAFHEAEQRFACIVAHRRAGKTVACVNHLIRDALRCKRPQPRFAYVAPFFRQAKDVAWTYVREYGLVVPGSSANETELRIDFPNGGRVKLYGADNPDALRGIYLDGAVMDEPADFSPRVWPEIIRPTLSDREGWAAFIGTPKGHNAFYDTWQLARNSPDWYSLMLKASQTGVISAAELASARAVMTPEQYEQEYECSFSAAISGSYYGRPMEDAEREGRVAGVPYDPGAEVHTAWDLGFGDSTAIWFAQRIGREIRLIDYIDNNAEGPDWYVKQLRERPYAYGRHFVPHDAEPKLFAAGGVSVLETLRGLGIRAEVIPRQNINDGINAVRRMLPACWFDAKRCARGIEALKMYRREYDEDRKTFRDRPLHDWTSDPADAFRYLALGLAGMRGGSSGRGLKLPRDFDADYPVVKGLVI